MIQQSKPSNKKIVLSLITLLITTVVSIIGIIFYSVNKANEIAHISKQNYVEATIQEKLKHHEALTKDYAYWEDTIKYAYLSQDMTWIKNNIGEYLTDTFKITDLFIINSQNNPVLALKDGQVEKSNFLSINNEALTSLVEKARQSYSKPPVPVSGILMINNMPALVAVSILTSEYRKPFPSPRPLLVMAIRLDPNYLQVMSKQYRLKDLSFINSNQDNSTVSSVTIKNSLKQTLGKLSWQPERPGNLVLTEIQLPLLILIVIITIISMMIIKISRATTHELEKAYDALTFNAYHDALTGLSNRNFFSELLEKIISIVKRENITCAMLYIDLDNFKDINDDFGHNAGDLLLVTIAERIKASIRESDYAARIGGDEFIIILYHVSSHEDIRTATQKILTNITQPVNFLGDEVQIGASIGVTIIPDDGTESGMLMSKADIALYECKEQGKNMFRFYSEEK